MSFLTPTFQGQWRDIIVDDNGIIIDITDWKYNQAQNNWATICAQLFIGSFVTNTSPVNGFMYLALGQGDSSWDIASPDKNHSDNNLLDEIDRIRIVPNRDIVYLDPDTDLESITPTRKIKLTIRIQPNRGIGDLREFGLVVGDATIVANSGTLFNWVDHDVRTHELNNPVTIIREITVLFLTEDEVTII